MSQFLRVWGETPNISEAARMVTKFFHIGGDSEPVVWTSVCSIIKAIMSEINVGGETVVVSVEAEGGSSKHSSSGGSMFDAWASKIVWFLVFLVPILSLPMSSVPLEAGKKYIFFIGFLVTLFFWTFARFKQGRGRISLDPVLGTLSLVPVVAGISALLSPVPWESIVGTGFDLGSVSFLLAATLTAWIVASYAAKSSFVKNYYKWLGLLAIIALAFQLLKIALPNILSFGALLEPTTTLIGKWNDFGIFMGLSTILSLIALLDKSVRPAFARTVFGISLIGLIVVNFYLAWLVVGIVGLSVLIYEGVVGAHGTRRVSWSALLLTVLSALFIFFGAPDQLVGGQIARLGLPSVVEVRPSWPATISIIKSSLAVDPVWGAGPNRFFSQWLLSKPVEVNQTIFWAVDFNTGVGFIPTFAVTTGLLGFLAWIIFIGTLLVSGIRTFMRAELEGGTLVPALMVWVSALYLWFFAFFYTPDTSLILLAFTLTGLYVAVVARHARRKEWHYSLRRNEIMGLLGTLLLVVVGVVFPLYGSYSLTKKVYALSLFNQGAAQLRGGSLESGTALVKRAATLDEQDTFLRVLGEANIARLSQLISGGQGTPEELRAKFSDLSNEAITASRKAMELDPTRYANWLTLGNVYRTLSNVKVDGAYQVAAAAYLKAAELYPSGPTIYLEMARLEAAHGDKAAAKDRVNKALEYKSNYTDAVLFLSQLESDAGNLDAAIKKGEEATTLSPRDVGVHFQLGLLYYKKGTYKAAAESLERAVFLVPSYSNARYFLALAYDKLGRKEEAVFQFTEIAKLNPNNEEVEKILGNLKAGRPALEGVGGGAPENRPTSPISETSSQ